MSNMKTTWVIDTAFERKGLDQFKKELESLEKSLNTFDKKKNQKYSQEIESFKESYGMLQKAFSAGKTKLGTTDTDKFMESLNNQFAKLNKEGKKTETILTQMARGFSVFGRQGEGAFRSLETSILTTNLGLKETNSVLKSIGTTMGNTIKWGISSSVFNSFTGSIQKAYGYVQNLDKSLNDIRIVSNQSAKEMANFAKQANDAATALGATTLDYTKAALIFYQQGLGENDPTEVTERTDIVTKMAKVTGDSADEVSSYMTAIWNNFENGSQTLEHYADVMTMLGARTASSTAEIAAGLEKFAAVADTVGLSYDYATAALATVVAQTRQSADVVGTAFKTLFARIQDLELGETLEDGTTLGKYSEALNAVGINIKTTSGEMKDMDVILNEMGAKWQTLGKDQQTALAQTVAGTRQYTQLIALMDNWQTMQENLNHARNASGELDKQQATYLESLDAHLNQLSAAGESLYDSFFDTDTMIELTDALTKVVEGMDHFVGALGGGGNTLLTLGSIATRVFNKQIAEGIVSMNRNMTTAQENAKKLAKYYQDVEAINKAVVESGFKGKAGAEDIAKMADSLKDLKGIFSPEQFNEAQEMMQKTEEIFERSQKWEGNKSSATSHLQRIYKHSGQDRRTMGLTEQFSSTDDRDRELVETAAFMNSITQVIQEQELPFNETKKSIDQYGDAMYELAKAEKTYVIGSKDLEKAELKATKAFAEQRDNLKDLKDAYKNLSKAGLINTKELTKNFTNFEQNIDAVINKLEDPDMGLQIDEQTEAQINDLVLTFSKGFDIIQTDASRTSKTIENEVNGMTKSIGNDLMDAQNEYSNFIKGLQAQQAAEAVVTSLGYVMQAISVIQTLTNITKILGDETKTTGEKTTEIAMAVIMSLGMVISIVQGLVTTIPLIGAAWASTIAPALTTFATWILGLIGVNVAMLPISATIFVIIAALAVLAAGVALIVVGANALAKAWNKDADAAKALAEQVQELSEAYNEANAAAEELKETIKDYNDAVSAIDECTRGTQEWKDAIEEANKKAKELIETNKLFNDWSYDENGVIQIDPDALNALQNSKNAKARDLEQDLYGAKIASNQANIRSQATDMGRDRDWNFDYGYFHDGDDIKAVAEAFNELTDESGKLIDASMLSDEQLKKQLLLNEDLNSAIIADIDAFIKDREELENFAATLKEASEANKYYAEQLLGSQVKEDFAQYFNAFDLVNEKGELQDDTTTKNLENTLAAIAAKNDDGQMQKDLESIDVSDVSSTGDLQKYSQYKDVENDEDLARRYAIEILGKDEDEVRNLNYDGGWGKGTLKTDDGTTILDEKNDEEMRRALARKAEEEKIKKEYSANSKAENEKIAESLKYLAAGADLAGTRYGANFTDAMVTSLSTGTDKIDLSSIYGQLSQGEVDELNSLSDEDLMKMFNLTDEDLDNLGYNTAQKFGEAFRAGLTDYEFDIDQQVANGISQLDDIEDLDSEDLTDYTKHIVQLSEESDKLADSLADDAETAAEVAKATMKMNQGVEKLAEGIEDWSDVLKNSSKESEEYCNALSDMRDAMSDVLGVSEDFISNDFLVDHLEDIEKAATGDEEAIKRLQSALANDIICQIYAVDNFDELDPEIQSLAEKIANLANNAEIEIGASLEDGDFVTAANELIKKSNMTVDQAQAYFNSLGYEPEFEVETKKVRRSVPQTTTHTDYKITSGYVDIMGAKVPIPTIDRTETSWVSGYKDIEESVQVPKISSGVKSLKKISSPSLNNFSSINKGGGAPGGGGGSSSKPSYKDPNTDRKDPYQKVNAKLKSIANSLGKIQAQEEKLVGGALIENLNQQIGLLNSQIDTTREKLSIAIGEQQRLKNELGSYGITFSDDGNIANYAAVYEREQQALNAVYARYNSMSKESQEGYEATVEAAEKRWEEFTSKISEYDTVIGDTIPGLEEEIQAAIDKQIEIQIREFNMEVEIGLNLAEAEEEWAEFKKNVLNDLKDEDILGLATHNLSRIGTFFDDNGTGILQTETEHLNKLLEELKIMENGGVSNIYGTDQQQALDDLKNYYSQAMSNMEALDEIIEDIEGSLLDMINYVEEQMAEQLTAYQMISDTLDHDMSLIKLISGEQSYSELDNYFKQKEDNLNSQLDFQRQQVELWQQQMETLEEGSEAWDAAKENWMSAVGEWQSSVTAAIENLQEKYANAIQEIFATINDELTNGKGLEYINQEWELINKNADEYLDTINAQFGIQTLQNKYLKSIEETDNLSAQRKLRDLMNEQVEALEAQDKLSEYDLERAELKYQIALKQIALEEAQQSKTSMRLRRDSQGNYSYQYTADDEQTSALQDELSKLYNDLYNLDKGQYIGNLESIYSLWTEYQEKMAEAAKINDPEARLEREKLLTEYYGDLMNNLALDNTDIRTNLTESAFQEVQELFDESYVNQEDLVMNQLVPMWDSGVQEMINLFAGEGGFDQVCTEAFGHIEQAANEYESSLQTLLTTAGVTYDKIKAGQDAVIDTTKTLIKDNKDLMDSYNKEIEAIKGVIGTLGDLTDKYKESEVAAKAATKAAYEYWAEQQRQQQEAAAKNDPNKNKIGGDKTTENPTTGPSGGSTGGSGSGTSTGPQGNGTPDIGDMVTYTGGYYYGDSYGGGGKGRRGVGKQVQITRINNGAPYPIHVYSKDSAYGWLKKEQLSGFDTGGYTGSWNTEDGRLALLHQKELVLNATDTENMLNAVNALRNITDSIGAMMLGRLANITAPGVGNIEDGTLEQNVHIDASFPNVTSSQEIENALNNLVNAATQHIHSKK